MTEVKKILKKYFLPGIMLAGLAVFFLPSCVHDPGILPDPNPIDTTGTPIDTTGIPVDTFSGTPCDPDVVYFTTDLLPILISNCAKSGCHNVASHEKGIILDSYQHVVGSDIIKPFDTNDSKMIKYITTSKTDDVMPPPPNQRLTSNQIAIISKWILQGAKDLSCDVVSNQCVTTNISYSGFVAPLITTFCAGCHSGGAPSGGVSLTTYAAVKAIAQSGRFYGAISWTSGFQKMPQGGSKLSQCNIDKIKGWIDEGALNN